MLYGQRNICNFGGIICSLHESKAVIIKLYAGSIFLISA